MNSLQINQALQEGGITSPGVLPKLEESTILITSDVSTTMTPGCLPISRRVCPGSMTAPSPGAIATTTVIWIWC